VTTLVDAGFRGPQRRVGSVRRAVVGADDDERVFGQAALFQRIKQMPEHVIALINQSPYPGSFFTASVAPLFPTNSGEGMTGSCGGHIGK